MSRYDLALGRKPKPRPKARVPAGMNKYLAMPDDELKQLSDTPRKRRKSAMSQLYEADGSLSEYGRRYFAVARWMSEDGPSHPEKYTDE